MNLVCYHHGCEGRLSEVNAAVPCCYPNLPPRAAYATTISGADSTTMFPPTKPQWRRDLDSSRVTVRRTSWLSLRPSDGPTTVPKTSWSEHNERRTQVDELIVTYGDERHCQRAPHSCAANARLPAALTILDRIDGCYGTTQLR